MLLLLILLSLVPFWILYIVYEILRATIFRCRHDWVKAWWLGNAEQCVKCGRVRRPTVRKVF